MCYHGTFPECVGPYEKDPENPILTSAPGVSYEREDPDHLKPKYYNPDSILQKSGHGSYVETPDGEVKLTSVYARITTKMEFEPEVYQHSAGLIIYYDNMNYVNLRKYYSETLGGPAISVVQLENGRKTEYNDWRVPAPEGAVWMRLYVEGRKTWFEWSEDGKDYRKTGPEFDTTKFSDEYCKYGEFTGTMAGLTCADRMKHEKYADFDFFEYIADETKGVE